MFSSISSRLKTYGRKLIILVGAIALMILAWANLFFHVNTVNARAATIDGISDCLESKAGKDISFAIYRFTQFRSNSIHSENQFQRSRKEP